MTEPVLVVAAAIVDDLDDPRALLAARRAVPASLAGRWEFPGGKVEVDEDPVDALHRELREELGVRVQLGAEVVGPDEGAWRLTEKYVMRLWYAELADGVPAPLVEHDEVRWLAPGQWLTVPWLDADVRIVEAISPGVLNPAQSSSAARLPSASPSTLRG
jgi:8-oxo-dGTP diphosphatase